MQAAMLPRPELDSAARPARPIDQQRRAQLFLTALWGAVASVEPMPASDASAAMPRLIDTRLWLPELPSVQAARAAAAHAGAHLAFSSRRFDLGILKARQRVLVEVIEDARVEALAIGRFPGLQRLWREQLSGPVTEVYDFDHLVARLVRALLDANLVDHHAWVAKGQHLFHAARGRWPDPQLAYDLGMQLANDLGQMRIAMNEGRPFIPCAYRDDNAHLWEQAQTLAQEQGAPQAVDRVGVHSARLHEADAGAAFALAADGAPDPATGFSLEAPRDQAALHYRAEPVETTVQTGLSYPEWDYRIQRLKQGWVSVCETRPQTTNDAAEADAVLRRHRHVIERLQQRIAAVHYRSRRRLRHQLEGDELDLDGLVENAVALRAGRTPDHRIYARHHISSEQDLALLVLLDLSASTNDALGGDAGCKKLDVARDACIVLSETLSRLGHRYAIHGFNSDGRHAVHYQRLLDFDEPFHAVQRARFGDMRGAYSTRMGAAIRHAVHCLTRPSNTHRLLLVITDGEPSDIDVHDRRMLIEDARHAVFEARSQHVVPFCLSLDVRADDYVAHIFGPTRFAILERVTDLPRQLPSIYFRLARRHLR